MKLKPHAMHDVCTAGLARGTGHRGEHGRQGSVNYAVASMGADDRQHIRGTQRGRQPPNRSVFLWATWPGKCSLWTCRVSF